MLGAWLLGETMNDHAILGGALILASVWLVMAPSRAVRPTAASTR
jgi:drug/metabolite transporter (DMT)-like permease